MAIKVVPQRMDHSDSVREAVELAVMSTVSHPNILGVQNFWTDVSVTSGPFAPGERRPNGLLRLESGGCGCGVGRGVWFTGRVLG